MLNDKMSMRNSFVKNSLEQLTDDPDVGGFFIGDNGQKLEQTEYSRRLGILERSVEKSYDRGLSAVGKRNVFQKYVATPLRWAATGLYGAGTGMFWALPGPAGFGFMGLGVLSSTVADVIDSYSYWKSDQISGGQALGALAEDVATKPASFFPVGTGFADLYLRGRKKYEAKIKRHMSEEFEDALDYAKSDFILAMRRDALDDQDERVVIPIKEYLDPRYAEVAKAA